MDEMEEVNWQEEIRQLTIKLIQEESKKKLLKDAERLRTKMKDLKSAEIIREDRNSH